MQPFVFFAWAFVGIVLIYLIELDWTSYKKKETWTKDIGYYITAVVLCGTVAALLDYKATQYMIMLASGIGAARVIKGIKKVAGTKPQ